MRILRMRVEEDSEIFLAGDTQWGNAGTSESGWDALCERLSSDGDGARDRHLCLMGDLIECITIDDSRFSWDQSRIHTIRAQRDYAISRIEPVKQYLRILLRGNHEHRVAGNYGDISAELASLLRCDYGGYVCVVECVSRRRGRLLFRLFLHHGFGKLTSSAKDSVQRRANMMAALRQRLQHLFAGAVVMAMGHTHQLLVVPPDQTLQVGARGGELHAYYRGRDHGAAVAQDAAIVPPDDRWYINTGSFLRTYIADGDGYAEMRGLPPVEIGYCIIHARGGRVTCVERVAV